MRTLQALKIRMASATDIGAFRALSLAIVCGISVACLWPFHAPENQVSLVSNRPGLKFGLHGVVVSSGPLQPALTNNAGWSLELWMTPNSMKARRHFLTFYLPGNTALLSLRQYRQAVVVSTEDKREVSIPTNASLYVADVFRPGTSIFLSITAKERRTSVFVDGAFRRSSELLQLPENATAGQIILGDSPLGTDSWSGWIGGLAVYGRELSPAEVGRHFREWSLEKRSAPTKDDSPIALFPFDEGRGGTVHNRIPGVNLTIPERYSVIGKSFLETPWHEFAPTKSYYESVVINVLGFLPFGFFWYGYLSLSFPRRAVMTALTTVVLGAAFSLTMEVLQAFLPTRSSGWTDVITNTAGSLFGVMLYRRSKPILRQILSRAPFMNARMIPDPDCRLMKVA